jgi:predicted CXXCH cytochrome family protein
MSFMKMLSFVSATLSGLTLLCCNPALGASCVTTQCHSGIAALKHQHAPVKDGDCASCHTQRAKEHPIKGGKSFEPAVKGAALCSQCHDAKGKKKVVHVPVKDGDCVACHQPHGASGKNLLNFSEDQTEFCMGCHDSAMMKQKFMHGPAAVGSCTECHDPHESTEKTLLKAPVRDLCLKCHADFAKIMKEASFVHPPVKNGPCTSCHNPHGSAAASFLRKKMPEFCIDCHSKIGKQLAGVKVPHKPVMQEGGCTNCHSAHFSKAKGLLPFDEMTTCLSCHDKDNLGKPALRNIKKDLAGKKYLHGPIQKGSCKACHDPHGSDHYRMLRGNYPADIYMPYKDGLYDACLGCHEKNLLRFPDTTTYTAFRNGNRNLHYVHVVNSRKGRTCRVCHEPHASNGPKMISKEGTQFGDWKIPVNFVITPTGGSCAPGCHRAFKYDRQKPENYHP